MPNLYRRSRSFPSGSRNKRKTFWFASADVAGLTNLAAATIVVDQAVSKVAIDAGPGYPMTIVRTRGSVWIKTDQVANSEQPFGGFGFAVVGEEARAAGAGSLPGPILDEDSGQWFVHGFFAQALVVVSQTSIHHDGFVRTDFDSKAMRKVEENEAIVVMLENASSGHGLSYIIKFRMLLKLH